MPPDSRKEISGALATPRTIPAAEENQVKPQAPTGSMAGVLRFASSFLRENKASKTDPTRRLPWTLELLRILDTIHTFQKIPHMPQKAPEAGGEAAGAKTFS
ncbi:hypothetical protein Bbelb_235820 [Branchiostoma belcheri]|nr:hypothetical protein Bbelb_235820 [Branchiostoma belcheri]